METTFKPTAHEIDQFHIEVKGLSDMDYGFNKETGKWDVPKVEWDSCYGRWWESFENEEARELALQKHQAEMIEWCKEYRERMRIANIKKGQAIAAKRRFLKEARTLGGQFPELAKLRTALAA